MNKFVPVLLFILFTLTQCLKEASSGPEYGLSLQNNYGTTIVVEIWQGEDLSYDEGNVEGKNLLKVYPASAGVNTVNDGTSVNTDLKLTDEDSFIVVIGVIDGGNVYVNHQVYAGLKADTTITINSNGFFE